MTNGTEQEKQPLLKRLYPIGSTQAIDNHIVQKGPHRGNFCSSNDGVVTKHLDDHTAELLCMDRECGYIETKTV